LFRFQSFVQAAATGASRKQSWGPVLEFQGADDTAQSVAQGPAFTPAAIPLPDYPEQKNRRKENQQIDRNQRRKADPNHGEAAPVGAVGAFPEAAMSLPHSIVACVQTVPDS
jgi:hypothetical protein